MSKPENLGLLWDIIVFRLVAVIDGYDLFNATTFIQNRTYVRFGIIVTQFFVNFSRQEHQIDVL